MNRLIIIVVGLLCGFCISVDAQQQEALTLAKCRDLALSNNKQLRAARLQQDVAANTRRAAKTKSLPRVEAVAGYELFSREVSILNKDQKSALSNLGTNALGRIDNRLSAALSGLVEQGVVSAESAREFGAMMKEAATPLEQAGNNLGESIRDAFRTDSRNMFAGSVMVTQPVYMGGGITAANELARLGEELALNNVDNITQSTLYAVDNAYWLAVSLTNKERLANDFLSLVKKLDQDVHLYIKEGVATRADGLKVDVAVNNAEMTVTQVSNGVSLAKMYLCQLCGLPISDDITLAEESAVNDIILPDNVDTDGDTAYLSRPEVRMLQNTIDMSRQTTKLTQALYRPHVAITGGVLVSNPNVFNGFERRFKDVWNIGVLVQMPLWNWHEGRYKVNALRTTTAIAEVELQDIREKISLQVEQSRFKLSEANKRLAMARSNMQSAEENLRCANVGFKEGVMTVTDVMEAQTAWQKAETQRIDAEIDVRLALLSLQKALGKI